MAHIFMPMNRKQMYLLPLRLGDWLPQDAPVWFVIESVEAMDLSAFYADYNAKVRENLEEARAEGSPRAFRLGVAWSGSC